MNQPTFCERWMGGREGTAILVNEREREMDNTSFFQCNFKNKKGFHHGGIPLRRSSNRMLD